MNRQFEVYRPLELSYQRNVLFAIEVLDAVTLRRVTHGLTVNASGLRKKPIINASGRFVWLREDPKALQKIIIEPGTLPFESVEISADQLRLGELSTVELPPRCDYPFVPGITGLRGTLIESREMPPEQQQPVAGAEVRLMWLDDDSVTWHDAPTTSHTNSHGDFAAILRFAPTEVPAINANGALSVRLRARRDALNERGSADFPLLQGRVADVLAFAWNELQP
jgi:hypothetical protein